MIYAPQRMPQLNGPLNHYVLISTREMNSSVLQTPCRSAQIRLLPIAYKNCFESESYHFGMAVLTTKLITEKLH